MRPNNDYSKVITFPDEFIFPCKFERLENKLNEIPNLNCSNGSVISFNHQLIIPSNHFEIYFIGLYPSEKNITLERLNQYLDEIKKELSKFYSIVSHKKNKLDVEKNLLVGGVEFEESIPKGTFYRNQDDNLYHVLFRPDQKRIFKLKVFPSEYLVKKVFNDSQDYLAKIPRSEFKLSNPAKIIPFPISSINK